MALILDEKSQVDQVQTALLHKYGDALSREQICAEVAAEVATFAQAPIRNFVAVLLHKRVDARLRAAAG